MQSQIIIAIVSLVVTWVYSTPLTLRKRSCVGGRRHGSRVDLGTFWYMCDDGELINGGCYAANRYRMKIDEKQVIDYVEFECVESYGYLQLRETGCVLNGTLHKVNQFWEHDNLWYYCEQLGSNLRLQLGGCVFDEQRIAKGQHVIKQSVVYHCTVSPDDTTFTLISVGCMHYAKQHRLGTSFQDDKFFYTCDKSELNAVGKKVRGCVYNNTRLLFGERYMHDGGIYECQANFGNKASHVPVGCVTHRGLKLIGERWTVGEPPYAYQEECLVSDKDIAEVKPMACAYIDGDNNEVVIEVGCFVVVNGEAVACRRRQFDNILIYTMFHPKHASAFNVVRCDRDTNQKHRGIIFHS